MPTRPLGRAPRTHDPALPHLSALLAGQNLPPPPGPMCNEQQVLTHILKAGAPTGAGGKGANKLAAFVEVDPRAIDDIKRTIVDCGVVYVGIKIPKYLDVDPWPSVWDVQTENDQPIGAHAVILAGYDPPITRSAPSAVA